MNSTTLPASALGPVETPAIGSCFHCGDALPAEPARLRIESAMQAFCCDGCAAAAQWIREADLDDYYRLRSMHSSRVDADPTDLALWDRDEVLAEHSRSVPRGREITLLTDGMRCAACAWLIDRAMVREPGVVEVSANAITGRIRLQWDPARTTLSRPLQRLLALGYRPYLATGEAQERARRHERNRWLLRLGIAGLGAMQAMMFAEALYLDTTGEMPLPTRDFLRWVTFLISTPVVFYSGWPFLAGCWRELRFRRLGMDTLIATSTVLAWGASVVETVRGGPHVWFDAAVMFVFLLLAARMLEQRMRHVATAQVDALARARPAFATRERADGGRESIPLTALNVGDILCVSAGEAVAADGELLEARARFEEALLTGESQPVERQHGEPIFAGAVCRESPARLRVTAIGSATRLSQLAQLVDQAQSHRPPVARVAEQIASRFVVGLLLTALIVFIGWRIHDPSRAFEVTLALLVISCPCALSLSIPAALAAAHGTLARIGVLSLKPDALERLARAQVVVFDKTGTLSDGKPVLVETNTFAGMEHEQALAIAAALEAGSGHPLAAAFPAATITAQAVETVTGQGVRGRVDGREWRLGQATFACNVADDGALWLGDGERAHARFDVRESARADAAVAVNDLQAQGLSVQIASGDAAAAVARLATAVGIEQAHSRQTPEDKLARVRALQAQGHVVAMVGDGINDAPVLAGADVSLAMGEGAALAQRAADLVITAASLQRIPQAIAIARRTQRVIRQNLAWAIVYNVLALPLAAAGWVTPWIAAVGMTLSSLTVTANALRLTRAPRP